VDEQELLRPERVKLKAAEARAKPNIRFK
jgi:hypothetical protein